MTSTAERLELLQNTKEAIKEAIIEKGQTVEETDPFSAYPDKIKAISGGGSTYPYDIPEFDGGEYGAIAYLDQDGDVAYYTATSATDLALARSSSTISNYIVKTLASGEEITMHHVLAYAFGSQMTTVANGFLRMAYNLQNIFGLESSNLTSIGGSFLAGCVKFNQPLVLPMGLKTIGSSFLSGCSAFNGAITLPLGLTSLGSSFLATCVNFNQPLALPDTLTTIEAAFLSGCYTFNQPLVIPSGLESLGANFLQNCYSFNSPLTLPNQLEGIQGLFLSNCFSFNQPFTLPNGIEYIYSSFMKGCASFDQPLVIPESVTDIGASFLSECVSFNQPITFPASVVQMGGTFMDGLNKFQGPVIVETPVTASGNSTLAVNSQTAPAYVNGVTLAGSGAQRWKNSLPDRTSSPYRKIIVDTSAS